MSCKMMSETIIDVKFNDIEYGYKPVCIGCEKEEGRYANKSLCLACWADAEGENE